LQLFWVGPEGQLFHRWQKTNDGIVKRNELHTFKVLPRRWVAERTFGWPGRYRRLNRDYERQAKTGETMVYLAMIRLMLARLGRL
jgi:putative transposase